MKPEILVENQFGHGAKHSWIRTKISRALRPKVGKAGIPFDWNAGFDIEQKIGQIPIKNQFQSSSCGGQAKSYWFGAVNALLSGQPYVEQSAKSIYSRILYPGGGTTVPSMEKDLGALDESILPSYRGGTTDEAWMTDTSWVNAQNLQLEMAKQGWIAKTVDIDIESIAEAIRDFGGVIWLIRGQNGNTPTWLSPTPKPPSKTNPNLIWGHFMYSGKAFSVNFIKNIGSFQSWGVTVGDNGKQYFTEEYINSGFITDVFTFEKKTKFIFNRDLKKGDTSSDVFELQKRLGVVPMTSYFGWITFFAVILYQKTHGIPETGFVGPLTRGSLNTGS